MLEANQLQEDIQKMVNAAILRLPGVVAGLILLVLFWLVARWVRKAAQKAAERVGAELTGRLLIGRIAFFAVFLLGLLLAASVSVPGFEFGTLVGSLGLGSVAIGFAFKEILENFIAGLYLMIARPFKVGDVIEIGGTRGTVTEIGARAATIQEFNREVVLMPCARLFKEDVRVVTANSIRRLEASVGIPYEADLEATQSLLTEATLSIEEVMDDPGPLVVATQFGQSSIDLTLYFFVNLSEYDGRLVKAKVMQAVMKALTDAKLSVPYPTRTIINVAATSEDVD
ncbi:MAG: mechanosensitive ion channel [Armatimonadetes bacterium]|nr:mechanosensitive ion channel [Armatimonadota bacterium]